NLVNSEVYLAAKEIEDSLMNRDTSKCLAWFNENKTKLKKNGVRNYHFQFIEFIKAKQLKEAVQHARRHLTQIPDNHISEFEMAMGLLVLRQSNTCYQ
ncbi:unnamed protein product, partial [Didymodactylos carnosus]